MDVPGFAVITGSASGIGRACAQAFVREGCAGVALLDLNLAALETVGAELQAMRRSAHVDASQPAPRVELYALDVSQESEVDRAVQKIAGEFGRIDYVVNCAGTAMKHAGGAAFAETADFKRMMDVNLNGTFFVMRAAAQVMLKQDPIASSIDGRPLSRGSIVNISSIQGVCGITLSTGYATAKHAVIGLTRTASEDYAADGLRINALCPGYTQTPLTMNSPDVRKAMDERIMTAVPMKRMGQPEEIADGVLYLAGGRSSFVTGSLLMVDGGYTCR